MKIKSVSIKDGINKTKKWDFVANLNILLQIENKLKMKFNTREFNSLNSTKSILSNVRKKLKIQINRLFDKLNIHTKNNLIIHSNSAGLLQFYNRKKKSLIYFWIF